MDILGLGPPSVCVATPLPPNTQVLEPPLFDAIVFLRSDDLELRPMT